ncbi:MAG: glycosyltransferase, partial [Planctomycetes bacterium]|nr:glycosyltransferase [Planctomycetota bacterium]
MRIALLVTDLTPPRMGGISRVATELACRLTEKGHEIDVFCLPRTAKCFPARERLRLIPVAPRLCLYAEYPVLSFSLAAFRALHREQGVRPYDVSHAMNFNNYGLTFWRSRLKKLGLAHVSSGYETTGMEIRAKAKEFLRSPTLHLLGQILMESYLAPWQRSYIG